MNNAALAQGLTPQGRTAAPDDEPGDHAAYAEYLRGFDDIPVLDDAVRIPPPKRRQPDFRRGERRDVRQEQRTDPYSLREATLAELALLYLEYTQPASLAPRPTRKKRPKSKAKPKAKRKTKSTKNG